MTPDQGDPSRSLTDRTRVRGHGVSSSDRELGDQIPREMLNAQQQSLEGQYPPSRCSYEVPLGFSPPGGHAETRLEQPAVVVAREKSSASLLCTANVKASYIHWYRYQEGKGLQRLLHLAVFQSYVQWDLVLEADKVTAIEVKDGYSCTLLVLKLEKSDEGMYYCAAWKAHSHSLCPGPPRKKVTDSGPFRPGTFHSLWVSGVVLGSALSNQTLAGTTSAGRALEAKEPLVLSVAQTQGAVQPGGTFLQIVRSSVSEVFGTETVLLSVVATSH
ncbi:T cell receptor gamma variable 5 [Vulpes lagopus]